MEIIIPAPQFLLWIILGIFVITVPAVLLKKGKWQVKIGVVLFLVIIGGILLFFFYRKTKLAVTDEGIYSNNYGEFLIKWEMIDESFIIDDLKNSDYNPVLKINGYSLGNVGLGWFKLENGESARVVLQTRTKCLVVRSGSKIYLFGPENFDSFIYAVDMYIDVLAGRETEYD